MIRAWRYLAAGVAAYALVLIVTFPAHKAARYIEHQVGELDLRSVSGSILSGQARQLVYQGLDLGPVSWRVRPLAVLQGRLEYRLLLEHEGNAGEAKLGRSITGNVHVSDLRLAIQPDRLINHYSPVAIATSGVLRLDIDTLEFDGNFPHRIDGVASWEDAAVTEPVGIVLGQLTMLLEGAAGDLLGTIDNAADAGISGELRLDASGRYGLNLVLRPGPGYSPETLEILKSMAQLQPDGDFLLQAEGQF